MRDATVVWVAREAIAAPVFGLVFAAVAIGGLRGGAQRDVATASLRRVAADRARERAAVGERRRIDALVHDSVLSALLAAAGSSDRWVVRNAAARSVADLEDLSKAVPGGLLSVDEVVARMRQTCSDLDETIPVHAVVPDRSAVVDSRVVAALLEVLGEAVRNSLRHAGTDGRRVHRRIDIAIEAPRARVTITDDGVGFDPARVAMNRLGVSVSILNRVEQLPDAHVTLDSAPGLGTTITVDSPLAIADDNLMAEGARHGSAETLPTTASDVLGLRSTGAVALGVAFLVSEALRPLASVHQAQVHLGSAMAVLCLFAALALLLLPRSDPLPAGAAAGCGLVLLLAAAATVVPLAQPGAYSVTTMWPWAVSTVALAFMAVRGRLGIAWLAAIAIAAAYMAWQLQPGIDIARPISTELLWQFFLLMVCSLFAVTLRRQVRRINATRALAVQLAAERADADARRAERDEQLAYLATTARPLLEAMSGNGSIDHLAERARLIEARLRDRIRARALAAEDVLDAAERARARGVEVTLLDDGGLDPELAAKVRARVTARLEQMVEGRITVRILPPGRKSVCTIVEDSPRGVERIEVPAGAVDWDAGKERVW
ncbi:hypothetical protein HT102_09640 [Hoyosella sp. G463]|uniref:Histidine kinase/HSP90-like ATPase domain-containing protein n=1 Tax=Lolliginicoccus lacisalsi TaxID=2742202 RepID=A0A927PLE9_9ACTN|nr:ATP-binding protein [Lolliginicoccus lacisalsi]MBD8506748.1 hypothetical protein [Lolliginicoccus lacisalsi]